MSQNRFPHFNISLPKSRLSIGLTVGFAVLAIAAAIAAFIFVRQFVSSWSMSSLDGTDPIPVDTSGTGTDATAGGETATDGALQTIAGPAAQPWDGVSRVTILVMGLDYEDTEERRTPRSDTMILFTIDPLSMTAGILTIPRDMWVNIPGYGYGRINTAYRLGEADQLPGGGPALAMRTVEEFIGVPIQYYAQLDFFAFTEFIDNIGGIIVNVPIQIKVDPLGEDNTVILDPGEQLLGGSVALAYARNRYEGAGDFDRSKRQMQVIMAIRDKILNFDMLPTLIQKAPTIYEQLSSGIHTNLTLDQVIQLALLAKDVPLENITQRTITTDQADPNYKVDGEAVVKPFTEKIRILRDEIFTTGGPLSPAATGDDAAALMKAENAKVQVLNSSLTNGLSATTTDYLKNLGVNTVDPGNGGNALTYTRIYDYSGKPYTVKYLVDLLGIQATQVINSYDPNATVDVVVELGNDWVVPAQ